jgi:hypothetical protein
LYTAYASVEPGPLLQLFQPIVTEEMNNALCQDFSDEEIGDALFQMGPIKASGPDQFPARFFQHNWAVLKTDIIKSVKQFFTSRRMPHGVNETTIVLIPKIDKPEVLKDYRPISLCIVIYKIVSKYLVNWLRPLLEDIISPTQSAFIPGRMITDNTLIAFEYLHAIRCGDAKSKKFGAFKIDLTKAYDHVVWTYLEGVLRQLGFQSKWVQWVMECVITVKFSARFNNVLLDSFRPTCGLRQEIRFHHTSFCS